MNQKSKRPVAIEDLLHLKRAERPRAEFWTEFDAELRAKQLAALVEKRPWWRSFPRALSGLARYHLPLGATAVLAVTLLSIRDYQPVQPVAHGDLGAEGIPSVDIARRDTAIGAAISDSRAAAVSTGVEETSTMAAPLALSSDGNVPGELSRMVPMLPADDSAISQAEIAPSARSIALNRAVAEAMLGTTTSGFETRALPTRVAPQEPLAHMTNPAETRRSRFAMAFAAAAASGSPVQTARVARRLSDEQLYDSIHRFGASGNSVSIRF